MSLKEQYVRSSEPTTQISLDEVVYNEKANTCYYWYSSWVYNSRSKDTELDEAIADLYSGDIMAQTSPHCAGKWCMTKKDFDKKKLDLGFTNTN